MKRVIGSLGIALLACDAPSTAAPTTPPVAAACPSSPLVLQMDAVKVSAIEQAMQLGIVVVAFDCSEVTLLSCAIDGGYEFAAAPRIDVDKRLTSQAEADTASPLWGTSMPPLRVAPGEVLTLKLVTVGQARASKSHATKTDLQGTCAGATHFVRTVHVGAFELTGTRGAENHEAKAGSVQECPTDTQSAAPQCRAPLQLELVPIAP